MQLRLKDADDEAVRAACDRLRPIVQDREVAFILNDRPDLAAELGCDGVHIGQDDATYRDARRAMGEDGIVGVTCHDSRHLAMEAADGGADYVAFGAFYPTATKEPKTRADPSILAWWSELMTVPCVAIGGITLANAAPLIEAGADFLAVSRRRLGASRRPRRGRRRLQPAVQREGSRLSPPRWHAATWRASARAPARRRRPPPVAHR